MGFEHFRVVAGQLRHGVVSRGARIWALAVVLAMASWIEGAAQAPSREREYLIGPDDVLMVTVFGQPDLTGRFTVAPDGSMTYPLVGRVKVVGLTTRAAEAALLAALSPDYLRDPQVTVSVETYRSQRFFVLGEVNAPGSFYLTGQETLIQAIARAGSTKPEASDEVLIVRPRTLPASGGPVRPEQADDAEVRHASLAKLATGDLGANIAIEDGDTIFVPRAESVFILGQVRTPGPYRYSKSVTVLQLLSMAGGATDRGAVNRIKIIRTENGQRRELKATLNDTVLPNDTVMVPEKFF